MRMVTAAKGPGRVGFAASSSETRRIGTLGSERISGSPTTTAARSGGAMGAVHAAWNSSGPPPQRPDISDRLHEAAMVEPVYPFQGGELDGFEALA